jgi:Haemolymph juvenile hormone binding protein (JHBP)
LAIHTFFCFCRVVEYASKYTFAITLPHLYVTGRYIVDGKVLFLPITGNGKITGNFTNGEGAIRLKGTQKEINGNIHFIVTKLDIKIKVESGKIELDNLFGGDKQLGTVINKVINDNFDTFTNDLIPLIEKSLAKIFKSTGNKILKRFTMAQLFP